MSESYFEMRIFFTETTARDLAIEIIGGDGPAFEEEVPRQNRSLFRACESIDIPETLEPLGETGLLAAFELYGSEAIFNAEDYMDQCKEKSISNAYAFFADDNEAEMAWLIINGQRKMIYEREQDRAMDDHLVEYDMKDRLEQIILMVESSKIPSGKMGK